MSELIDRQALLDSVYRNLPMIPSMAGMTAEEMRLRIAALIENAPTASHWHRVKDGLPKPHKDVLVSGMEAINNMRVYKVMVNDNGTWRPTDYAPSIRWDYWMPIEPPKEDA